MSKYSKNKRINKRTLKWATKIYIAECSELRTQQDSVKIRWTNRPIALYYPNKALINRHERHI
nr:MAG TPA: hypothetical protein [Bacteriophage sp.]